MEFGFNLNLEQKQTLIMTPQLQMAIEILQFSSQDLEDYVEEEIKINPLLEKDESIDVELKGRLDNQYLNNNNFKYDSDDVNYENFISYKPSLSEYLESQFYQVFNKNERLVATYIVGNLDDNGFLTLSIEEISKDLGIKKDFVKNVLRKINYLDPIGIGAKSLQETLLIQLDALLLDTELAKRIVEKYIDELAEQNYNKIIEEMSETKERVMGAINLIKTLDPKPASRFSNDREMK
jgi:RNA polymerase sigma-54 factor